MSRITGPSPTSPTVALITGMMREPVRGPWLSSVAVSRAEVAEAEHELRPVPADYPSEARVR